MIIYDGDRLYRAKLQSQNVFKPYKSYLNFKIFYI